jgi:hypothetical protein
MFKTVAIFLAAAVSLSACGGGGSGDSATPTAKTMKISLYGQPLTSSAAVSHARAVANADAPSGASDAAATVQSLQDALKARGVPATVTPQVMDGTTLHQIVIGENNGLPPTPDQFKTDPSEFMVVHFELDDMTKPWSDPTQQAALAQFQSDLFVFIQRGEVAGKRVFVVDAIPNCDVPYGDSAADGLNDAIGKATSGTTGAGIGLFPANSYLDQSGTRINAVTVGHMGADCRTPDASLLTMRTNLVADYLAERYEATVAPSDPAAASGAAAGT